MLSKVNAVFGISALVPLEIAEKFSITCAIVKEENKAMECIDNDAQ